MESLGLISIALIALAAFFFIYILPSIRFIGPSEVGLVEKRFSLTGQKLKEDNAIAFHGEPGYQADLLMPGWHFRCSFSFKVTKHPWVQVPAGEIGVVIAQVGAPLAIGAKSATYKKEFGNFSDLRSFTQNGGQKGVQRPVLPPGTCIPVHPVGFIVITKNKVFGLPISPELQQAESRGWRLTPETFGLRGEQLELVRIMPLPRGRDGKLVDMIGIVTTLEGDPLPSGDIASRLLCFSDIEEMEDQGVDDSQIIDKLLGSQNDKHNNYQDFQAFIDSGGKIGLQHDPLLYGAYALNPFLVSVEMVPMLVVDQGEVAVIKAYVGLVSKDISGKEFKFGTLVRPGRRGIWQEALRTGKYAINPRCYDAEIVPTSILTLNWSESTSQAHCLDAKLSQIIAKSKEGFIFRIDLQVQIHVPDTQAPKVISIVGTMTNLVNEVLAAAVGNHFRDKIQSMPAIRFIETRQLVQEDATVHVRHHLEQYQVETRGVYIQDVVLPEELVKVLTQREIANQEIETYKRQQISEETRIEMEKARGTADMQSNLAKSKVGVDIKTNESAARKAEAEGEAFYIRETGIARGAEVEAVGLARARAYKAQVEALGQGQTALVNVVSSLADSGTKFIPDILVAGGGGNGSIDGLAATLMKYVSGMGEGNGGSKLIASPVHETTPSMVSQGAEQRRPIAAKPPIDRPQGMGSDLRPPKG